MRALAGDAAASCRKIIAAYNAGPLPVAPLGLHHDQGDPLLWIESIPYWETRYYVPAVLRNMWVYQGLAGRRDADAERARPAPLAGFPGAAGTQLRPRYRLEPTPLQSLTRTGEERSCILVLAA